MQALDDATQRLAHARREAAQLFCCELLAGGVAAALVLLAGDDRVIATLAATLPLPLAVVGFGAVVRWGVAAAAFRRTRAAVDGR